MLVPATRILTSGSGCPEETSVTVPVRTPGAGVCARSDPPETTAKVKATTSERNNGKFLIDRSSTLR
jgi:hypothetical protein